MKPVLLFSNGGKNSGKAKEKTNFSVTKYGNIFVMLHYLFT